EAELEDDEDVELEETTAVAADEPVAEKAVATAADVALDDAPNAAANAAAEEEPGDAPLDDPELVERSDEPPAAAEASADR
ncbi:MAG: hypothetical protein ACJA0V_001864, partial [Planctomycetota bacterium]